MSESGRARPTGVFISIDRDLIPTARKLVRDEHPASAVVAAHAATEVVSEFIMGVLLSERGVPELERPLSKLARFHLTNDNVRRVYEALSGDDLGSTELWNRFMEHKKRRDGAAHAGVSVSLEEASQSVEVCDELIRHLFGVLGRTTTWRRSWAKKPPATET
jgi:hypothetical protein